MRKKVLGTMCVSLGVSAMALSGCGSKTDEKIQVTTEAVKVEESVNKEVEEVKTEIEVEESEVELESTEDIEIEETDIVLEKKLSDSYSVNVKNLYGAIKSSNTSNDEQESSNSLGFKKIDVKNAFGIASSTEQKTGIRQYELFKTEVPSDVYYLGIMEDESATASLFFRGDITEEANFSFGMPLFADLGAQGLDEYGVHISFSECSEEARQSYLKSFIASNETLLSNLTFVEYGGVPFYISNIEESGLYGKYGFTIEDNYFIMLFFARDRKSVV